MAKVHISKALTAEILRKFKGRAHEIIDRMETLEANPNLGKPVGHVSSVVIKELKWDVFRFYCITDGYILKFGSQQDLERLLIEFVRMSDKKTQESTISEIKEILRTMGRFD